MMTDVLIMLENVVGEKKRENAGYQHFLLFFAVFSKSLFLGV